MAITLSLGLLLLRLVAGLTLAVHGAQRFGWFGGSGFTKAAQGMQKLGFNPGWFWTSLTILGELGGGLSLAFGFLTPLGAAGAGGAAVRRAGRRRLARRCHRAPREPPGCGRAS